MLTTYEPSKNNRRTFNDGWAMGVKIDKSSIVKNLTGHIPFGNEVIGMNRFFRAKQEDVKLSKMISLPSGADLDGVSHVEVHDYRKDGSARYFRIVQVQEIPDSAPPCLQVSLEDVKTNFKDLR